MQDQHDQPAVPATANTRSATQRVILAGLALLLIVLFASLGTWQVMRLQWKTDLIARVDARVHAEPVAPPEAARWPTISQESDEYRRVRLSGHYLYELTTPVQALSKLGSGFWLLTPMCTGEGHIIIINRGFIASSADIGTRYPARKASADACAAAANTAPVEVTGLLRLDEPGGGFLRENDSVANRWYGRDLTAIATARGLAGAFNVAPFFIDAGSDLQDPGAPEAGTDSVPVGGLTVVSFQNSHLVYALTWYALALMVAAAWWWVARHGHARTDDN